jgi:hypothetical protein
MAILISQAIISHNPEFLSVLTIDNKGEVMEPITTAILAVLPTLASDVVKSGVKDAYEGLKAVIRRKWGESGPITKSITELEEDPKSNAKAAVLEENSRTARAACSPTRPSPPRAKSSPSRTILAGCPHRR